jgi:hypothetical protein
MKPSILILVLMSVVQSVSAQFIFKPEYISIAPYPLEVGNTVILQALNPLPDMHFYHKNVEYSVGDTIANYAFYDTISCVYYADTMISVMSPYQDFEINMFQPASNLTTYDGQFILHFDHEQIFFANTFEIIYTSNGAYGYLPTNTDSVNFHFNGMVPALFTIYGNPNAHQVDDNFAYRTFRIGGIMFDQNLNYFALSGFRMNVLSISDVTGTCNGGASVQAINASGPVSYTWDANTNLTGNFQNQLCPGIHSVLGKDLNTNHSALKQFIITDSTENYYDPSINGSTFDTLNLIYMNCNIDYNSPIDSIDMSVTVLYESNDTIYNQLNLFVYQGSNAIQISDIIITPAYNVYYYNVAIYCNSLKSGEFNGKKIFSVEGANNLSILDQKSDFLTIYPNPTSGIVQFSNGRATGKLFDTNMKCVQKFENESSIDISKLCNGIYFIYLEGNDSIFKLIKN